MSRTKKKRSQTREAKIKAWYEQHKDEVKYDDSFGAQAICPSVFFFERISQGRRYLVNDLVKD